MGFISEGTPVETERPIRGCKVWKLLESCDEDDRTLVEDRLRNVKAWSDDRIAGWLAGLGVIIAPTTVRHHRIGVCCNGVGKVR